MGTKTNISAKTSCYHCGDRVLTPVYKVDDHEFCCLGCQSVYQILSANNMQQYYTYNTYPGKSLKDSTGEFAYLDEPAIADKLIDFKNERITIVTFYIPVIHCSACIWLLEHLYKLNPAVKTSRTDFMKKQVSITFEHDNLSFRELVELLANIGYGPKITLQDVVKEGQKVNQKGLIAKIAVAGFCFGNSMMLSFPEYFGMGAFEVKYAHFFGYLNLAFGIPVMFYSGVDYFKSAWYSLRQRQLNLDVPLALGILVLFIRTAWEVLSHTGPGFADTLCGLVFFLLVGRWVQQRTYYHISFERDYRSYFPVAVTLMKDDAEHATPIGDLQVGDRMLIRSNEIVPADAILLNGHAAIDFSFVTGESEPVEKVLGEVVYAGGRQTAEAIELEVVKPVSQSYLTKLWNNDSFKEQDKQFKTFSNTISRYFTIVLLTIALSATTFWLINGDSGKAWGAFTAVLIIACPCALALSSPFTLSAAMSIFDRNKLYVKNASSVEQMAAIDTLVFDKTGTISSPLAEAMYFKGNISPAEQAMVVAVCRNSGHPLSRQIVRWLGNQPLPAVSEYVEYPGKGTQALVNGQTVRVGNAAFAGAHTAMKNGLGSSVYVSIDGVIKGCFHLEQPWREGLSDLISCFKKRYDLHLISGDNDRVKESLRLVFPQKSTLLFNQSPGDKLEFINGLQQKGHSVCMLGDGLNDAGALKQADMGIAVSDDINNFSPGCNAILDGSAFGKLPRFFRFAKDAVRVIHMSFVISLTYNIVGLSFAVQGTMSPLFAAILMPLSTVTIIGFTSIATHLFAAKRGLNKKEQV